MQSFACVARRCAIYAFAAVVLSVLQSGAARGAALTISGTPKSTAIVKYYYSFRPTTSGREPSTLRFSVTGKPSWASLSPYSGTLYGVPQSYHIGTYSNIRIYVTDGTTTVAMAPFSITVKLATSTTTTSNRAPVISGTPSAQVLAAKAYYFRPTASDADGNALTFSITNRPAWASFSTSTGTLSGTPTAAQVGTYSNIKITVSDGRGGTAALPVFSVAVVQAANGSATVRWTPPTQNTNGSTLTNLSGYRIYYGKTRGGPYGSNISITNLSLSSYVVSNLTAGTYYFVVTSRNSSGVESQYSNEASKMVN